MITIIGCKSVVVSNLNYLNKTFYEYLTTT